MCGKCQDFRNLETQPFGSIVNTNFLLRADTDDALNADVGALQSAFQTAGTDAVYAITVGSEALYRGNLNGDQLLAQIQKVQKVFPNLKIGTADSWNKYVDGTADPLIKGGVKLLYVFASVPLDDLASATNLLHSVL